MGCPEGESLGSGFPIGASSIPVGTRFCLQSLVCYTFCSCWRWKGAVSCQTETFRKQQNGQILHMISMLKLGFQSAKSGCSYVGDADILAASEKIICITGEQKGYIKYYGNSNRTFSKAVCSVDFALLSDRWKCFAVSVKGCSISSSNPKRYQR